MVVHTDELLKAALDSWQEIRLSFSVPRANPVAPGVPFILAENCIAVAKDLERVIIKFGAAGATIEAHEVEMASGMAKEMSQAFLAMIAMLVNVAEVSAANQVFSEELQTVADNIADALSKIPGNLGVGNNLLAQACGAAIEKTRMFGRISLNNKTAARKRILRICTLLKDATKELAECMEEEKDEDFNDDWSDELQEMEPEDKAVACVGISMLEKALAFAKEQMKFIGALDDDASRDLTTAAELNAVIEQWNVMSELFDNVVVSFIGGVDRKTLLSTISSLDEAEKTLHKSLIAMDPIYVCAAHEAFQNSIMDLAREARELADE